MDGYPLQPFNLSGNQTDGGTGGDSAVDDGEPFAQVGDLEARWHALTCEEYKRAEALLADASDLIRTTCPRWPAAKPATLKRIACRPSNEPCRPAPTCRASPKAPRRPAATAKA